MAYVKVYTAEFTDVHVTHPAIWTIDFHDDQAAPNSAVLTLKLSVKPLILEYLNISDDKMTTIIGRQATISYEFTGESGMPDANVFFDADERRFMIKIYKSNVLQGVFYVKPDGGKRQRKAIPYTITITAVDGLSFLKTTPFNAFSSNGLLSYIKMSLYDIIMTRGLLQILDSDTPLNSICTLKPSNISSNKTFMNDLYIHCDMFYDFVKGPIYVYDVLNIICKQFSARIFIANGQVWFVRIPDLFYSPTTCEQYIAGVFSTISINPSRSFGENISANDGVFIDQYSNNIIYPAIKEVTAKVEYKSINQLLNFQWDQFDGTHFANWSNGAFSVSRNGAGTLEDPYRCFIPFSGEHNPDDPLYFLLQGSGATPVISANVGSIFNISFKYLFSNTQLSYINCYGLNTSSGDLIGLNSDGSWVFLNSTFPPVFTISRSGTKRDGSFSITSLPIPKIIGDRIFPDAPFQIFFGLHTPSGLNNLDGAIPAGIDIYPVKLGISPLSAKGRDIDDKNSLRYSKKQGPVDFSFIDTGVKSISNSIFVTDGSPAKDWKSLNNPTDIQTIERHFSDGIIDQYSVSINGLEGNVYSNNMELWNIISVDLMANSKLILMGDKYDVQNCTRNYLTQQLLPENGANTIFTEVDSQ